MSPPEIKTAEPPAQSDDLEPARKAREAMEIAEEQAAQKNASKYAKASFDSGLQLKQQGLTVFDQLDYTSAMDLFQRAKEKFEESVDRAEKEGAIEQTRVKAGKGARSRTAAAQSRAISWRNRMSSAKTAAEKVSAAALAEKSFNAAKQKEREARRSFSKKRFQTASTDFQHAQQLYLSAAAEARTASANFATQAEALRNSLQTIKDQLDAQYVFLDEYQQAAKAERNGDSQLQSGNGAAALQSYRRATELYEASITVREGQIANIRSIITQYGQALEKKDLQLLKSLYVNFTQKMETEWSRVFKTVDNIEAQLSIEKFSFRENGVTISVDVRLKYSGFVNSDNRFTWQIQLAEASTTWLISNISRGR
jgi:tetratricopeptide (TPR) repeat protein